MGTKTIKYGPFSKKQILNKLSESLSHNIDESIFLGFNNIDNYYQLSSGWYEAFEQECVYCLHMLIKNHGNIQDKVKFNHDVVYLKHIKPEYIFITNRKEKSWINKIRYKNKKPNMEQRRRDLHIKRTLKLLKNTFR